jgi:hypothetical protein
MASKVGWGLGRGTWTSLCVWVHQLMQSQIIAWVVQEGMKILKACSSEREFPSVDIVTQVIDAMDSGETLSNTMVQTIASLDKNMDPVHHTEFWMIDMLHAIDHVVTQHFSKCGNQLGMPEDFYFGSLHSYVRDVILVICQHTEDQLHCERVVACFMWAMHPRLGKNTPMLLMTGFVLVSTKKSTNAVSLGTSQVSSRLYCFPTLSMLVR